MSSKSAKLKLWCAAVWLGALSLACGGCAGHPRFPELCERYNTVLVGKVVVEGVPDPQPILDRLPLSTMSRRPAGSILFPHDRVEVVVKDIDRNFSAPAVHEGDTLQVFVLRSHTSLPYPAAEEVRTTIHADSLVMRCFAHCAQGLEYAKDRAQLFALDFHNGRWFAREIEDPKEYLGRKYYEKQIKSLENLTPAEEYPWTRPDIRLLRQRSR